MCEIAVVPGGPAEEHAENYIDLAATLYQQNSHGLGIVAVYDESEGREDAFDYSYYKTTDPTNRWQEIYEWLGERSHAWRFVFHARLATAGGKSVEATHPLVMEDEDLDSDLVVHNGQVYGHKRKRRNLENDGHEFATGVDSEVIAHQHADVPETLDDFDGTQLRGNLNYLLFADHGILIRNSGKYTLSDDLTMSCRPVNKQTSAEDKLPVGDDDVDGLGQCFALFKPDGSFERMDASRKTYTTGSTGNAPSRRRGTYTYGRGWTSYAIDGNDDDEGNAAGGDSDEEVLPEGAETSYTDKNGVEQVKTNATVEYADTQLQDELERHTVSDNGFFYVSTFDSVIKDDHFTITVKDNFNDAIEGARLFVKCPADDMEYTERGVYKTDETGAIMLPEPEEVIMVTAKLVTVPKENFPEGALPADDDDDDDGDAAGDQILADDEVGDVDWWFHYDEAGGPSEKDGFCSLCMSEFEGDRCDDCLERHDREDLLETDEDDLEELREEADLRYATAYEE